LDVVLVESFLELKTFVTFPGSEANPELLSTIARCSPLLQKLQLNFYSCGTTSMKVVKNLVGSLSSLKHLTQLSLSLLNPEIRQIVLSLVVKFSPLLTHLSINGYPHGNQEILSLILGETTMSSWFPHADYLRASCYDEKLDGLIVPKDRLTPMCSNRSDRPNEMVTPLGIEKLFNIKAEATAKLESLPTSELQPDSSELVLLKHKISNIPGTRLTYYK